PALVRVPAAVLELAHRPSRPAAGTSGGSAAAVAPSSPSPSVFGTRASGDKGSARAAAANFEPARPVRPARDAAVERRGPASAPAAHPFIDVKSSGDGTRAATPTAPAALPAPRPIAPTLQEAERSA